MTGQPYSIKISNKSLLQGQNAIVFQQQPTLPQDVYSLAWLAKACNPGTWVNFDWTVDFNFVWGQNGVLKPGVKYEAGQVVPADLSNNNQVTLTYPNGGFMFGPTGRGPLVGSLFIGQGDDVPGAGSVGQGSVGIGMAGSGTFVTGTQPTGAGGVQFEISPVYWVAFGSYEEGTVVTEDILTFPTELAFPTGMLHAECAFTGLGWDVVYS